MSLLSRALAPPANHELADLVAALLTRPPTARPPTALRSSAPPPTLRRRSIGPSGLGGSAARIASPAGAARIAPPAGPADAIPDLYCPPAIRDDPALAELVNDELVEWATGIGIYSGQIARLRSANFGRLIVLAHPDCDDPDRLLAAAKCALAEWAVDDHYVDGEEAEPARLGQRLAIAYAAIDPAHLPVRYAPQLEQALRDDPVMVALRSSLDNLARYATAGQVARLRHELAVMFVAYNQEGVWRTTGRTPPVWEYLMHRHENSFLPCMALIDALGGYELPAAVFAEPAVRRAFTLAGTASVVLNDLYSMTKEDPTDTNLPRVIAVEEQCSLPEAVERSAAIHDELVRRFEAEAAALTATGSPVLYRFLAGVWAWLGGNREWHRSSERYR
jgi:2-methylisoborneol synthase